MKSKRWLELAKKKSGLQSDYKLAQAIGMTRGAVSHHMTGKITILSDEACERVAELTGEKLEVILADQHAEQAKSPALRAAWKQLEKHYRAGIMSSAAFLVFPALSKAYSTLNAAHCILCSIAQKRTPNAC